MKTDAEYAHRSRWLTPAKCTECGEPITGRGTTQLCKRCSARTLVAKRNESKRRATCRSCGRLLAEAEAVYVWARLEPNQPLHGHSGRRRGHFCEACATTSEGVWDKNRVVAGGRA